MKGGSTSRKPGSQGQPPALPHHTPGISPAHQEEQKDQASTCCMGLVTEHISVSQDSVTLYYPGNCDWCHIGRRGTGSSVQIPPLPGSSVISFSHSAPTTPKTSSLGYKNRSHPIFKVQMVWEELPATSTQCRRLGMG